VNKDKDIIIRGDKRTISRCVSRDATAGRCIRSVLGVTVLISTQSAVQWLSLRGKMDQWPSTAGRCVY